jgi:hypothetical protein
MSDMRDVQSLIDKERQLGFERLEVLDGSSYRDSSTVIVVPTRGMIHHKVTASWDNLLMPMNQRRSKIYAVGDEVGIAYNRMIEWVLAHDILGKYKFVMTVEDDNTLPPDAHIKLLESIDTGPFDAVSGLYFTKGDINLPMAYGDPKEFARTGRMDFRPRDVRKALETGNVMEVNGIGMGCALWRMELFRQMTAPWFVTVADVVPDKGPISITQDLYFCERMRRAHKRIAVDLRVRVGHVDRDTGEVY